MSQFLVLTSPPMVNGYLLAGADVVAAADAAAAEIILQKWLKEELEAVVAIDDSLFHGFSTDFVSRLNQANSILYVIIPRTSFSHSQIHWQQRIREMIRQAIGIHITFKD